METSAFREGVTPLGITVKRVTDDELSAAEWDDAIERSPHGTVFHRSSLLAVLATHSGGTLHRLAAFKGQELRGLFPVFELSRGPVTTGFSPPPQLGVPYLGPVLVNGGKLKRRKYERTNRALVEGTLDWLRDERSPSYIHVETGPAYGDIRPFAWNEFDVRPRYTYVVDLTPDIETIEQSFSQSLRRYTARRGETEFEIEEGGEAEIKFVYEQTRARYEAQGKAYDVPLDYLLDQYRQLPAGTFRPYVATHDGDRVTGILVLQGGETVYFGEGGGKPDVDLPVNDQLHWVIMTEAKKRGLATYDLQGANTPRICDYKAKFNPELAPYFEAEWGTRTMRVVSDLYRRLR